MECGGSFALAGTLWSAAACRRFGFGGAFTLPEAVRLPGVKVNRDERLAEAGVRRVPMVGSLEPTLRGGVRGVGLPNVYFWLVRCSRPAA